MQRRTARLIAQLTSLLLVLAGATFLSLATSGSAAAADRDCSDFATQAAAQNFFLDAGGPRNDPHALDDDGDGIACEANPCPCSTNTGGGNDDPPGGGPQVLRQKARIVRIVDGDTAVVKLTPGPKGTVRFLGIDAPEANACGGDRATETAERLLPVGTRVLLVSDPTQSLKDRYGRLLRYVHKGSKDIDLLQLRRGMAKVLVVGKPFQRIAKYKAAQARAKAKDLGNWADCY